MDDPELSFYFAIKHKQNPDDNIWHKESLSGKDDVVKLLLKRTQNNGWKKDQLTNPSAKYAFKASRFRRTCKLCSSPKWSPER